MTINNFLSLTLILFFLRLFSFVLALPGNFDNIWRPGEFEVFPPIVSWILIIISIIALVFFIKKLKQTDDKTKKCFFIYFAVSFVSVSLFYRTVENTNISYLMLLMISDDPFSAISSNIILDCFFDPPYVVWSLGLMFFIYYICIKFKHLEYSIPFWIIPFSLLGFHRNDFTVIVMMSYCLMAIIGLNNSKKLSSFPVFLLQFIVNILSVIYVNITLNLHQTFILAASTTLLIFYVPSFIMFYFLYRSKNENSLVLSWILPASTMFFLFLPLFRLITIDNLIYFISICNMFIMLGNTVLIVAIITVLSLVAEKVIRKTGKFVFLIFSIITAFYYILDAVLCYYSHFRLNYQTIAWTMTMNDIKQTTLATCLEYLSPISISLIVLSIAISIVIYCHSRKILSNDHFKLSFIFVLLASQLSSVLLQLSSPIPQVLRDPFFELINSLPISSYFSQKLSMDEINKGFEECNISLKKYTEKEVKDVNTQKTNVIFITLESVHWRYVNMFGEKEVKTWPLMSRLKNRMVVFPFVFSCFPESTCGDYAMITSLIPFSHLFINQNQNMVHKGLVNELKKLNYNTYMFASGSLYDGGLIHITKTMPFDYSFTFSSSERVDSKNTWTWGYKEEFTSKTIIDYLKNRDCSKPYFIWYRSVYPHAPFDLFDSKEDLIFQNKDEFGRIDMVSKYKNALIYLDKVFYKFINDITELDKANNQQTLIVMVGDHGEMLGEKDNQKLTSHGLYTNAWLQNVVCIMIKPQADGLQIIKNYGSQIDITPTILDYLKIKPSVDRYEQGESLYSSDLASRTIYLSSVESYGLVENGYFFEFRNKLVPNVRITKLSFSDEDLKPKYEPVSNWSNHKEIYDNYCKVKKFFKLQEDFLNQLK